MPKGYNCNAVQEAELEISDSTQKGEEKGEHLRLIEIAQQNGGESEAAMRATERLLELNCGLVRNIAMRFRDRGVDMEDLLQIGTIGLIRAIRSFDTGRGTQLSTYAFPLIFGEIRRYMRDEGPIKVGRYYKQLGAALASQRNRIFLEEGREAHIGELAALCSVSVEDAAMALEACIPPTSLSQSAFGDEDGVELEETIADDYTSGEAQRIIDKIAIREVISSMPRLWQSIVEMRFFGDMTQSQVAASLGLTQVKVSREEKKIIEYMRCHLVP